LPAGRKGEGWVGNRALAERLAATGQMPPRSFEQYRRLAATLHQAQVEKSIRVVMVTSAVAGEGKTLTAANLALTLAESYGRNTLLIDADLRRPAVHELFDVPNVSGLSDGLRATAEQKLSLRRVSPRLSVLTAGQPDQDPAGLLTSESMRRIVEEAAAAFDWVVIDTPPVGLLADAKLLAAMVDTVLFVVHAASTPYPVVQRAIEALGRQRVLGVVLNQVEDERRLGQDKYYHYYYGPERKRQGR
jgi:capsular exopolysaccharide synthesis family protein